MTYRHTKTSWGRKRGREYVRMERRREAGWMEGWIGIEGRREGFHN